MLQSLASALFSALAAAAVCAVAVVLNAPMVIRRKNAKRGRAREDSGMGGRKFERNVSDGNGGHAILVEPSERWTPIEEGKPLRHLHGCNGKQAKKNAGNIPASFMGRLPYCLAGAAAFGAEAASVFASDLAAALWAFL